MLANEGAIRSKGTVYFTLHQHGVNAVGRWVGLSYDGPIITGWGALAKTKEEVVALMGQAAERREGERVMTEPAPERLECVEVVITAESAEWLADFTRSLVEERLVACGHNLTPIRAIYRWEGRLFDEAQARVALHTRASLVIEIIARADRDHADDVPCVIAMPISDGNEHYLQWVYRETLSGDLQ